MRKTMIILLAGLLICACVPIQPEPKDGLRDLANALAKLDEHPDPTEYLELLLELDVCVRDEMEGDAPPILSEAESVAMTIYTLGALMAARTFERHEAICRRYHHHLTVRVWNSPLRKPFLFLGHPHSGQRTSTSTSPASATSSSISGRINSSRS